MLTIYNFIKKIFLSILKKIKWVILGGVILWLINTFSDELKTEFKEILKPKFTFSTYTFNKNSTIEITSTNWFAKKQEPITLIVDGIKTSQLYEHLNVDSNAIKWYADLSKITPSDLLKDGRHIIKICFENNCSEEAIVFISNEIPKFSAKITDNNGTKNINVLAAKETYISFDTLNVNLIFFDNNYTDLISLPVKSVYDKNSKRFYFEFESTIQNIPRILSTDPNYSKPFFAFEIFDHFGNRYYQEMSYAEYIAPGEKKFGLNNIAEIKYNKKYIREKNLSTNIFQIKPSIPLSILPNGETSIFIKVTLANDNSKLIKWSSNFKDTSGVTVIYRDNKKIGTSLSNTYIDLEKTGDLDSKYKVEKKDIHGQSYSSKEISIKEYLMELKTLDNRRDSFNIVITKRKKIDDSLKEKSDFYALMLPGYNNPDNFFKINEHLLYTTFPETNISDFDCAKSITFADYNTEIRFRFLQKHDTTLYTPIFIRILFMTQFGRYKTYEGVFTPLLKNNRIRIPKFVDRAGQYEIEIGYFDKSDYNQTTPPRFYIHKCTFTSISVDGGYKIEF